MGSFKSTLVFASSAILVVLIFNFVEIEAAAFIQPPLEVPDKYECYEDEGCYSNILDVMLPYGIPVNPIDGVHCRRFECLENGNTAILTCGVVAVGPGCTITRNMSLPYPDCCNRPVCPPPKPPSSGCKKGTKKKKP